MGPVKKKQLEEKLERLGVTCPSDIQEKKKAARKMNKTVEVLKKCFSGYKSILDNAPKPYPTSFAMSNLSKEKHTLHGRRFEVSMYMFESNSCSCCGRVKPGHVDPDFPRNSPFERRHLINPYHKAWKCTCEKCKGCQFYCDRMRSHIKYYKLHHNNLNPWEVLGCSEDENNAILCDSCYKEVDHSKVEGKGSNFFHLSLSIYICMYFYKNCIPLFSIYIFLNRSTIFTHFWKKKRIWTSPHSSSL